MPAVKTSPQRKFALTKIKPGDYLLPSNDGRTIWRIAKYEDGPTHGLEEMSRDRDFWGVWRWDRSVHLGLAPDESYVDTENWERWEMFDQWHDTRQSAIEAALRAEPRSGNGRITA